MFCTQLEANLYSKNEQELNRALLSILLKYSMIKYIA